jgi:hypothetical protein
MTTATGASLEHAIGADGLLALRLRDGEVRLRAVDGETVGVRDVNDHDLSDMFEVEAAAGSLSLKDGRGLQMIVGMRSMRRGGSLHTPELDIELPRRATLVLESSSGDVEADGLLGDQRYRTASGDVVLRAVSGRIAIEVVSGDIEVSAIGEAQVSARSVSGDVEIRAATLSALQVTTTSGDMKVAGRLTGAGPFTIDTVSGDGLLAPAGDVRVDMTSLTGDLATELEGTQVTDRGRRSLVIGTNGPVVVFRSMSGDLSVVRATRVGAAAPPQPPGLPAAPRPAVYPSPTANGAIAGAYDAARLRILRLLERGEIDVAEAGRRLETLDAGDVSVPPRVDEPGGGTARPTDVASSDAMAPGEETNPNG